EWREADAEGPGQAQRVQRAEGVVDHRGARTDARAHRRRRSSGRTRRARVPGHEPERTGSRRRALDAHLETRDFLAGDTLMMGIFPPRPRSIATSEWGFPWCPTCGRATTASRSAPRELLGRLVY